MYELLLLTKSGREISVGTAANPEEAKKLGEAATQMLGGLKAAQERNDVVVVQSGANVYWLVPSEIEGLSLFYTGEAADAPLVQLGAAPSAPENPNVTRLE